MAGTIIDSLIVLLGLDSKDLLAKSPEAVNSLDKIEKSAEKTDKTVGKVSETAKETAVNLQGLTRGLTALLSVIGGTMAVKAFVADFISTNAQLERFSKNIGVAVSTVSAWSNASEQLGGSAQGLQSTMAMLSKSQTQFMLTGESNLIPYFSALGVSLMQVDAQGKVTGRTFEQIATDLNAAFNAGRMGDRTTANNMLAMMGFDQGSANLILQTRKELELGIARQKEHNALTEKQGEEAVKLQKALIGLKQDFAGLGRTLITEALPYLEKALDYLKNFVDWAQGNKEVIGDFLKVIGVGLAAIAIAAAPIELTTVAIVALAAGIALVWQDYQTWKAGGNSFLPWDKWEPEITAATKGIQVLSGAIETAWGWFSKFHDSPFMDKLREKLGVDKFWGIGEAPKRNPNAKLAITQTDNIASSVAMQKYFIAQGWTPAQAAGIAANLISESGGRANATGDKGSAYGIGQWHKDRQDNFAKWAGHSIQTSTAQEQMAFVQYELTQGTEVEAGKALKSATNAQQAGDIVSKRYERPKDAMGEGARRGDLAQSLGKGFAQSLSGIPGASGVAARAPSVATAQPMSVDKSVQVTVDTLNIHTQAKDSAETARDTWNSFDYLLAGQANSGMVP